MKLKSYSKINLSLRVMNRLKNGMHNIETNSVLVNIFDEINIQKDKKNLVIFKGKFKSSINKKKNSILKTLKILKKLGLISNYYKIIIKKKYTSFCRIRWWHRKFC